MMSERSAIALQSLTLEEPGSEQNSPRGGPGGPGGPLRCGPCAVWPRQQTWLCAVPLVMGFVGLGLSLMLLKWIVVGSVQDYVPTDLVDPKGSIAGGPQDPIFLSKPSAVPNKGPPEGAIPPEGGGGTAVAPSPTTTTTASMVSTTTPLAADGTAPAPRTRLAGPPANHSANGSAANGNGGGSAPHLHNRVGTRVSDSANAAPSGGATATTTRASRVTPPPPVILPGGGGKEVTPRSAVKKGGAGASGGRNGASSSKSGQTSTVGTTSSSATAATVKTPGGGRGQPPTSPSAPGGAKPTSRWGPGRSAKGPATRPHYRYRTPAAPTSPSLRSEVFKPCVEDKDLAFCLNEGECSIIQTVAGVHRHCRCKEGYHGLRCDQFVPKTDAILSDPTDELGIEFMESGETYQRQVLSIFSIASGICLLGVACMALYRRNKRHREKLRAHFTESRILRDCSVSKPGLMSKSTPRLQYSLQAHKSCGYHGSSSKAGMVATGYHGSSSKAGMVATGTSTVALPPSVTRALSKGKRLRSSSLSLSPAPKQREANHFRTPPIPRGKHHLVGGCRVTGHVYKHLQEVESTDVEAEYLNRYNTRGGATDLTSNMQTPHVVAAAASRTGWTEVPCTRLDKGTPAAPLPSSLRARSVPIIPSLQQPRDRADERPAAVGVLPKPEWRSAPPARKKTTTAAVPVGPAVSPPSPGETTTTTTTTTTPTRPVEHPTAGSLRSGGRSRGGPPAAPTVMRETPRPVETAVELEGGNSSKRHNRSLCGGPTAMGSAGSCSDLPCGAGMDTVVTVVTTTAALYQEEGGTDKHALGGGGAPFPGSAEATALNNATGQTEAPPRPPCRAETTVVYGGTGCISAADKGPGGRERGDVTPSSSSSSSSAS